jgi:hypothetical protein
MRGKIKNGGGNRMNRETGRNTVHYPLPLKAAVLALALSAAMTPSRVRAAGITVDAGGTCTLAEAITSANSDAVTGGCTAGSGADTITLEENVILTAALPDMTTVITIEGGGYTIDGNNDATVGNVLRITFGGDLTLNEATVTGSTRNGISDSSSVTVNNSTISGNTGSGFFLLLIILLQSL